MTSFQLSFEGIATLVSVIVAIVAGWVGLIHSQRNQKQNLTLKVMSDLLTIEKFSDANVLIMKYVENKKAVDLANLDPREDNLFMSLLSMYEFISINFLYDQMDREIILRQRRSGLLKTYEVLANYIAQKRIVLDRPSIYRSFEEVVTKYAGKPR